MTYKETFFFVAKCLTVSHDSKNKSEIEIILKNSTIDWDSVVKLSTSHMVLVSLFFNLKNANFLNYLPTDLVKYMKYIARLNKNRNHHIISQLNEINDLLLKNEITPIDVYARSASASSRHRRAGRPGGRRSLVRS